MQVAFEVDVAATPGMAGDLAGRVAVVIDTLRATSTIVTLLSLGAARVYVTGEVQEAAVLRTRLGTGTLLCGERRSRRLEGFDHGNSPVEFAGRDLRGRLVVLTTTNGTRAFHAAGPAALVLAGSLLNLAAVAEVVASCGRAVTLVCSGEGGGTVPAGEDSYTAGLLAGHLGRFGAVLAPAAEKAFATSLAAGQPNEALPGFEHARALVEAGFTADVEYCARVSVADVAPVLHRDPALEALYLEAGGGV